MEARMKIRIGTFNVENLIYRYDFSNKGNQFNDKYEEKEILISDIHESDDYSAIKSALMLSKADEMRQLTAQVIADMKCDIICLQEIDELDALNNFNEHYISKSQPINGKQKKYKNYRLVEGNDPRKIDVGLLSTEEYLPIARSHAHLTFDDLNLFNDELAKAHINPSDRVFRRDCLEAEFTINDQQLTLFICHFKSQGGKTSRSDAIRNAEAMAVRKIIEQKFGNEVKNSNWIVLGDLNQSAWTSTDIDSEQSKESIEKLALQPLLADDFSYNAIENIDLKERWTHYYPSKNKYSQLDYILLSPKLASNNELAKVEVFRKGLPFRAGGDQLMHEHETNINRYPGVGIHRPKASDHCGLSVELDI